MTQIAPPPPRYIAVDLILPAREMARVDAAVSASDLSSAGWVRECVRDLGARNGVDLGGRPHSFRAGPWQPRRLDVSKQRHSVLFPREWLLRLNRLAQILGVSKSAVLRIATMQRVNGIL